MAAWGKWQLQQTDSGTSGWDLEKAHHPVYMM